MKKHTKVFLVIITLMAIGMSWHYYTGGSVNFDPKSSKSSAIDAVATAEKKDKPTKTNTAHDLSVTRVDLESSAVQTLIFDTRFRKMILDENFRGLLELPEFTELSRSEEFYTFVETQQTQALEKSAQHSEITKNPMFIKLSSDPQFIELLNNNTLTAILRSGQFAELEKMTLKSFE